MLTFAVQTAPPGVFFGLGVVGALAGASMLIWRQAAFRLFGRFFRNEYYDPSSPKARSTMLISHTIAPLVLLALSMYMVVFAVVS